MRYLLISLLLFSCQHLYSQEALNKEQAAWLYRIVDKTPVLQRNWQAYFEFDKAPFYRSINGEQELDYDAVTTYQSLHPASLNVLYDSISLSSCGLLSEAAIKLTLWELNEALKKYINRDVNGNDSLLNYFRKPLLDLMPTKTRAKKKEAILKSVMHPSLPIFKKIEQLDKEYKLDVLTQKELLNKWSALIASYSHQRSLYFYRILSKGQDYMQTTFLAAGEGSGTAGLLYETERHPNDSSRAWYGKGIGLFTYKVSGSKNRVRLLSHLEKKISLPAHKAMTLHTSLWGLNSSFKPIIIVSEDGASYRLFADFNSKELSADASAGIGISHLDRIEQYRHKKITIPLKALQDDGALANNLNKEYASKETIDKQLKQLGNEIDTLLKYEPENEAAITHRKKLIDSKLTNLSNKERRIKELEQKMYAKNSSIAAAEKKLEAMTKRLGSRPQAWHKVGNDYIFDNGVRFNTSTQDLVFPANDKVRDLTVRLLSAAYSLEGSQKDEVQAYVSITNTRELLPIQTNTHLALLDTSFHAYFHPDAYHTYSTVKVDSGLKQQLLQYKNINYQISSLTVSDSLRSTSRYYTDRQREYKQPLTIDAHNRKATITLQATGDSLNITVLASCDPVPTRLSLLPPNVRHALNISSYSADHNQYLQVMRALSVLFSFAQSADLNIDPSVIDLNLAIDTDKFSILFKQINTSD